MFPKMLQYYRISLRTDQYGHALGLMTTFHLTSTELIFHNQRLLQKKTKNQHQIQHTLPLKENMKNHNFSWTVKIFNHE